jgi:hypothetical protein
MTFAEGRLEIVGIQFRSNIACPRWLETPEFHKTESRWTFRETGGRSIVLLGDARDLEDELIRNELRKAIKASITRTMGFGQTS